MTGFDFRSVTKAPKGAAKGKCLPAHKLAYELGVAVLRLSLDPARPPIHRPTVQAVSPVLDAAYQQPQSTIPTYLGQGRSEDGLGLHRPKAGPYPVCRENAALALRRLEQLGHPPARVAALLGTDEDSLLAALAALPDYDAAVAALVASAAPPSPPKTSGGSTAGDEDEGDESEEEAQDAAPQKETAREYRERLEAAERAKEAERQAAAAAYHAEKQQAERERAERDAPAIAEVMAQLTDDEE